MNAPGYDTSEFMDQPYIRASEVGTFEFCRRSWQLSRQGAPSALAAERARGTAFHQQHGEHVMQQAAVPVRGAWIWLVVAVVLALIALVVLL